MAQYGHNFYGTSYYGKTNAFSGWYQTREIIADELLKNTVNINIRTTLPSATYGPQAQEIVQVSGTWTYNELFNKLSSDNPDAELKITATGDLVSIEYEQLSTTATNVKIEVTTTEPGKTPVVQNFVLDSSGTTNPNAIYKITGLPFGEQKVRIILDSANAVGKTFNFKGLVIRTSNLVVESRSRLGTTAWPVPADAAYSKLTTTITAVNGTTNDYIVSAITPNYAGNDRIQYKIYLASSDNETTPEVQYVEIIAGDSNNRNEGGQWTAIFNMEQIAIQSGVSFSKVEEIVWTESVPSTTTLTIRSNSSTDNNIIWDGVTVPYKQNINRIRLKEGYSTGWIDAPYCAPADSRPYVRTVAWESWDDQSFLPPNTTGAHVEYKFLSIQKDNVLRPYHKVIDPMKIANRNLIGTNLKNLNHVVRFTLQRAGGEQTPVVDFLHLKSSMHYEQEVPIENQEFSAVSNNNTGKQIVLDTNLQAFRDNFIIPVETSNPTYYLEDETKRPTDVILYFDSEKNAAMRKNSTASLDNKVWAEAKVATSRDGLGLVKHYQYGGGQVKYPLKDRIQMAPIFTPSTMKANIRYGYHLESGWPTQSHKVMSGESLSDIASIYQATEAAFLALNTKPTYNNDGTLMAGQILTIPNDSVNPDVLVYWDSTGNERTDKSSHNASVTKGADITSDSIVSEVLEGSIYGFVDWVSEEKIYDGVINPNDIRNEYKRIHMTPSSGDSAQIRYTTVVNDTYKSIATLFGVEEIDIRKLNNLSSAEEPEVGKVILISPRIILPSIHPRAIIEDNPYQVQIVYNSVKKSDATILPEDVIVTYPLEITYEEVDKTAEIIRGDIANGKDSLPSPMVTSITSATSGIRTYNPWDEALGIGDFKLTDNQIDWGITVAGSDEPVIGTTYIVYYKCLVPKKVAIRIDTTYQEEGGVDRIWRSTEVKEFKGMCSPGVDYIKELPEFSTWKGLPDSSVEDIQYIIEDNDIWVKTWTEERDGKWYVIGSLQDLVPKDNWFPTIKTGYYYLGKEEYYLFNKPITIEPGERDIPVAKNIEYRDGKYMGAAYLQEGSENLVRNSGFEATVENETVFKLLFA